MKYLIHKTCYNSKTSKIFFISLVLASTINIKVKKTFASFLELDILDIY